MVTEARILSVMGAIPCVGEKAWQGASGPLLTSENLGFGARIEVAGHCTE
jgi:hypothetical protein